MWVFPLAVSVLRLSGSVSLSAIGLRDHQSSFHNNRRAHTRIHSRAGHKTRTVLSKSDGEMLVKLRFTDSFLFSFTSARSAGKPLRCAQPGTHRSWNKGNTGGRGGKKQRGRFSCEDDWLVTKETGSPSGFGCHPLELDGGPACSYLDSQRFF